MAGLPPAWPMSAELYLTVRVMGVWKVVTGLPAASVMEMLMRVPFGLNWALPPGMGRLPGGAGWIDTLMAPDRLGCGGMEKPAAPATISPPVAQGTEAELLTTEPAVRGVVLLLAMKPKVLETVPGAEPACWPPPLAGEAGAGALPPLPPLLGTGVKVAVGWVTTVAVAVAVAQLVASRGLRTSAGVRVAGALAAVLVAAGAAA